MNDRTAARRRATVDGREPAPAAAELGRIGGEHLNVDAVDRVAAGGEPALEVGEVGGVGSPCRLGQARAVEETVDCVHPAGFAPCSLLPPHAVHLPLRRARSSPSSSGWCSSCGSEATRRRRRPSARPRSWATRSTSGSSPTWPTPFRTGGSSRTIASGARRPRGSPSSRPAARPLLLRRRQPRHERPARRGRRVSRRRRARRELVGPDRCLIWATIWRDGAPNDAFNAVLREAAEAQPRVRLVAWAEMVELHPDGSQPTACTATRRAIASGPGPSRRRRDPAPPTPAVSGR